MRSQLPSCENDICEIRDGQCDIAGHLTAQRAAAEERVKKSRDSIAESVAPQRLALARQRTVTLIAVPAIIACIAAIAYRVLRYF